MAWKEILLFFRELRPIREQHWLGVHQPKSLVRAGSVQLTEKLLSTVIVLFSTIILSRILPAGVFGLVAMVRFFQTLLMALSGPGFTEAVVQVKDLQRKQLDGIFVINLFFGTLFGGIMALGGPFIASFYGESELTNICRAFGFIFFLQNFSQIHLGLLHRNMKVEMGAVVSIAPNICNLTVAVILALNGFGVWSIIGGSLTGASIRQVLLWHFIRWRPERPQFKNSGLRTMVPYGLKSNLAKLVAFIADNSQTVILGKMGNPADVGYFNRAETLYRRPLNQFASPLIRLFLPKMASMQDDRSQLIVFINRATWFLSFFIMPFAITMMVIGDWVLVLLLGSHWEPSGQIVRWIALAYIPVCLHIALGRGNAAIGRPARLVGMHTMMIVILVSGFIHYAPSGPLAVVKFLAFVKITSYPIFIAVSLRGSGFPWKVYAGSILRLCSITCLMTLVWLGLRYQLGTISGFGKALLVGGIPLATYCAFYFFYRFTQDGSEVINFVHHRVLGALRKRMASGGNR